MIDPKEDNRNQRRDKKNRKRHQMVVSEAGRRLAEILQNLRRKK